LNENCDLKSKHFWKILITIYYIYKHSFSDLVLPAFLTTCTSFDTLHSPDDSWDRKFPVPGTCMLPCYNLVCFITSFSTWLKLWFYIPYAFCCLLPGPVVPCLLSSSVKIFKQRNLDMLCFSDTFDKSRFSIELSVQICLSFLLFTGCCCLQKRSFLTVWNLLIGEQFDAIE
jgi:hypothetical protein